MLRPGGFDTRVGAHGRAPLPLPWRVRPSPSRRGKTQGPHRPQMDAPLRTSGFDVGGDARASLPRVSAQSAVDASRICISVELTCNSMELGAILTTCGSNRTSSISRSSSGITPSYRMSR